MSKDGRVLRIWIKRAKRGVMDEVAEACAQEGRGLEGNANQGGKRQITLIERERWEDIMDELAADLDPSIRRANLLLEGIDLRDSRGKTLQVGNCKIRIYGETRPCERMEEALPGLGTTMGPEWRGGAYGEVVATGQIRVGDTARWLD